MDGLDGEAAELELAARRDLHELGRAEQAVLLELVLDESDRQARGVDGDVEFLEEIRQAADVVLMAVRDDDAADAVLVLHGKREVGDDEVDAEHVAVREHEPAVDHDHVLAALVERDVLAHFAEAAQRIQVDRHGRSALFRTLARTALESAAHGVGRLLDLLGRGLCRRLLGSFFRVLRLLGLRSAGLPGLSCLLGALRRSGFALLRTAAAALLRRLFRRLFDRLIQLLFHITSVVCFPAFCTETEPVAVRMQVFRFFSGCDCISFVFASRRTAR